MTRYTESMRVGKTFRNYFYGPILPNKKQTYFLFIGGGRESTGKKRAVVMATGTALTTESSALTTSLSHHLISQRPHTPILTAAFKTNKMQMWMEEDTH